jgi:hypothetical protein
VAAIKSELIFHRWIFGLVLARELVTAGKLFLMH